MPWRGDGGTGRREPGGKDTLVGIHLLIRLLSQEHEVLDEDAAGGVADIDPGHARSELDDRSILITTGLPDECLARGGDHQGLT